MAAEKPPTDHYGPVDVDLKDRTTAVVLAWLWPGAGHLYQGRYAKAILFMVCILGTFFFGLHMGNGHVVYASWNKYDRRLPYLCQIGVGLPALPALVQAVQVSRGKDTFFKSFMVPPKNVDPDNRDELAKWNEKLSYKFDLGTVFTMIAGLLNVLVIYDAGCGPVFVVPDARADKPPPDEKEPGK